MTKVKKKAIKKLVKKRNPEFEQALEEEARLAEQKRQEELKNSGRLEQDNNPDAQDKPESTIPPKANQAIAPVLKIPFAIWSNIKEIPEIRLSTEEAQEWAVPVVGLLEFYFPGKVPEFAWIWLCFLTSTAKVIDSRIEIVHQYKKKLSTAPQAVEQGLDSRLNSASHPAPKHNGAEPSTEFPKDG